MKGVGIVLLILLVVAGGWTAWYVYVVLRRKKLAEWARRKEMSFSPEKDRGMDDRYRFDCLRRGRDRYALNIMEGWLTNLPVIAFDYHYVTGHGKHRNSHNFSAVIVESPIPLEPLVIRREGLWDKVKAAFGYDDIDFDGAPEFSKRFFVGADDEHWARDVIHRDMIDYLMTADEFAVEFRGRHVIATRSTRFAGRDFENAAEMVRGIFERFSDEVVKRQTAGGEGSRLLTEDDFDRA